MFIGEKVRLTENSKDEVKKAQRYLNDPEVRKLLTKGIPYPYTLEDEEKWYQNQSANNYTYNFAIKTLDENKYIGGCGINVVDWKNRTVTIGIFIGDKDYWGKGYGTDAMKVLIKFIFEQMNINKIKLHVFSFNKRAQRCYEKCGFKVEGVLRQELFVDGEYHDDIVMGLLKDEYEDLKF